MNDREEPCRILFVCTANICRSPAAEALARHRFGEERALFRSAGFLAADQPCPDFMVQSLQERGIDATAHRSYRLDEASLEAADLVLTMEGEHVQRATLLSRNAFAKIVPLKEAADRMAQRPPGPVDVARFIEELNVGREPTSYLSTRWDVADPYRRKLKDYRRAVDEIGELVGATIGPLLQPAVR